MTDSKMLYFITAVFDVIKRSQVIVAFTSSVNLFVIQPTMKLIAHTLDGDNVNRIKDVPFIHIKISSYIRTFLP